MKGVVKFLVSLSAAALVLGAALIGGSSVSAADPAPCKGTGWFMESAPAGDLFDKNGDGYICTNILPATSNGDGNSANSQRGAGQTGYHIDGHNHKDN